MSGITTHILDTARGKPAADVAVRLEHRESSGWVQVGEGRTDADGRLRTLTSAHIAPGEYRLHFDTGGYFTALGLSDWFFPTAVIDFRVLNPAEHFHVPLLLSPWSYSTYRGS